MRVLPAKEVLEKKMKMHPSSRGRSPRVCFLSSVSVVCFVFTAADVLSQESRGGVAPSSCQYIAGTLVPQLVAGVRQVGDEGLDALEVFASPEGPLLGEQALFLPFFVTQDGLQRDWVQVQQEEYGQPLGWVRRKQVVFLESRYGYVFSSRTSQNPTEFFTTAKEAYERHVYLLQGPGRAADTDRLVAVRQRLEAEPEIPRSIKDRVPFVDCRLQSADVGFDEEYPDTTPSFRYGLREENRLLRLGVLCGGRVDDSMLGKLRETIANDSGLEMLFVIDETSSMRPYFDGVAEFLDQMGQAAERADARIRASVAYYSDGDAVGDWLRVSTVLGNRPGDLGDLRGSGASSLANEVRMNLDKLPKGVFADAPERSVEALYRAVTQTNFSENAHKFVVIIGDTGYLADSPGKLSANEKEALLDRFATEVKDRDLTVFFLHVGRRRAENVAEDLFRRDCLTIRRKCQERGAGPERIQYVTAETNNVGQELVRARERSEVIRLARQRLANRLAGRTQLTEPGGKLLDELGSRGYSEKDYNDAGLQYYVPARAWYFHPLDSENLRMAEPQFEELLFLAREERAALAKMMQYCAGCLEKGDAVDLQAAVSTYVAGLRRVGRAAVAEELVNNWLRRRGEQATVGLLLEEMLGLRVDSASLYDAGLQQANDGGLDNSEAHGAENSSPRLVQKMRTVASELQSAEETAVWFKSADLPF